MTKVLIVDDSATLRELTRRALAASGLFDEYVCANDGLSGVRLLASERPDLVICDLNMPGAGGRRFLDLRRASPRLLSIPVILLTSDGHAESKADLLEAGASDYVVRPFHPRELVARVRLHLELRRVQAELAAANTHLLALVRTDALTGLANRRAFDEHLDVEVARSVRYGTALSLAILDIDHFKRVNDVHGHAAGDQALRGVAAAIGPSLRRTDVAARFGGEEIAILMPHTEIAGAVDLAERTRVRVACIEHVAGSGRFAVTVSIGVATADARRRTAADLFGAADEALYRAKREGRDRVVAAGQPEPERRPARISEHTAELSRVAV